GGVEMGVQLLGGSDIDKGDTVTAVGVLRGSRRRSPLRRAVLDGSTGCRECGSRGVGRRGIHSHLRGWRAWRGGGGGPGVSSTHTFPAVRAALSPEAVMPTPRSVASLLVA